MIQIYQGVEGAIFLSNNKNLKMTAYTELKRRILRNELKPNEYLEEKQLCEMLGISRTPLREALSQLEREQLVVIVPTKGTFVADMSVKTAKDIFQMRHILEPIALRMAMPNLNPDLLLDYRRRFVSNLEKKDYATLHQMDYEFHNDINKRCGNDYMIRVLSNLSDQFQRIRTQDFFHQRPNRKRRAGAYPAAGFHAPKRNRRSRSVDGKAYFQHGILLLSKPGLKRTTYKYPTETLFLSGISVYKDSLFISL